MENSSLDSRFNAITNRHMIAFYTIRRLAESNRDAVHGAIESARQGVREWSTVGRRWAKNPSDLTSLLAEATQAAANTQSRSLTLLRQWWDGVQEVIGRRR